MYGPHVLHHGDDARLPTEHINIVKLGSVEFLVFQVIKKVFECIKSTQRNTEYDFLNLM